ncbi:MAG: hypothetical protein IKN73_00795 [Alphaproteobacteria bacterium]|nr:hypothetical protein [Alphaproteobacteria bacterium]
MPALAESLVRETVTCWTCPIFDNLFVVISKAAGVLYQKLSTFAVIIFCILFAFYMINVVWQNMKKQMPDPMFQKSLKPVLIKSLLVLALLSAGLSFPKLVTKITFEPTADMTLLYTESLTKGLTINDDYQKIQMDDSGMFSPQLRDTIIKLLQTSVSNFQIYINVGISIMDAAFSLHALFGIGNLIKHIIIFFIGLFLTYNFIRLFIRYSFCFMDVIFAMAMFGFFFPLSIIFFIFKDAQDAPGWMKNLGGNLGAGQIKKLINAIVSVASAILTYTIIMLIIQGFLTNNSTDVNEIKNSISNLYNFDLENSSIAEITFAGSIVLVYVIRYIADQIPKITEKIMSVFGVKQEDSLSKEMGSNMLALTDTMLNNVKQGFKTVINPEAAIKEQEKQESKDSSDKKDKK